MLLSMFNFRQQSMVDLMKATLIYEYELPIPVCKGYMIAVFWGTPILTISTHVCIHCQSTV